MFSNLEVRAYVVNLNDYNDGILTGGWIDLPQEEEEINELVYNLTDEGKNDYEILDIDSNQKVGINLYDNFRYDLGGLNKLVNKLLKLEKWQLLDFARETFIESPYSMNELGEFLQCYFAKDPERAFNLGRSSKANFSYRDPYFKVDGDGNLVSLSESEYQEELTMLLEEYFFDKI